MTTASGDVLLYQTPDDGEINIADGVVELSGGLESAAYLSLFGGNEDDDGSKDNPASWWGNLTETQPVRQQVSRTQYLLRSIPALPVNLLKIEAAAKSDLAWFVSEGVASSVDVVASIPTVNRVDLVVTINADERESTIKFSENWKVQ